MEGIDKRKEWIRRFKRMTKHYGLKYEDISAMTGISKDTIAAAITRADREFPRWLRLAIVLFEKEHIDLNK